MHPSAARISLAAARRPLYVGIDVGGTNVKIGLVDDAGQTLCYRSIPTEQEKGAEDGCGRIAGIVRLMLDDLRADRRDLVRAGIATPGPLDIPAGKILRPGNVPGWWDFPIRERLSHHLNMPVSFANDANAAAYGEFWRGAAADLQSMVLLTLGTGIGGGIIVNGMLVEGTHSCGGECGHILVDPHDDAWLDSLGKSGSLEAYANASAVVRRVKDALAAGEKSSLSQRLNEAERLSPRTVAEEAEKGDKLANRIVLETAHWLAIGIVTFVHAIDPNAIVLGGAMDFGGVTSPVGRAFLHHIRDTVRPRLLEPLRDTVKIEFASLGGDAGYIGAAGLARIDYNKK